MSENGGISREDSLISLSETLCEKAIQLNDELPVAIDYALLFLGIKTVGIMKNSCIQTDISQQRLFYYCYPDPLTFILYHCSVLLSVTIDLMFL